MRAPFEIRHYVDLRMSAASARHAADPILYVKLEDAKAAAEIASAGFCEKSGSDWAGYVILDVFGKIVWRSEPWHKRKAA